MLLSLLTFRHLGQTGGASSALLILPQIYGGITLFYFQNCIVVYTGWQFHRSVIHILCYFKLILLFKNFVIFRALFDNSKWLLLFLNEWNRETTIRILLFLTPFIATAKCTRMSIIRELRVPLRLLRSYRYVTSSRERMLLCLFLAV